MAFTGGQQINKVEQKLLIYTKAVWEEGAVVPPPPVLHSWSREHPKFCMAGQATRGKISVHRQLPSTPKTCLWKVLLSRKARTTKMLGKEI